MTNQEKIKELLTYASMVGSYDIQQGSKVKKLLKRNKRLNANLYDFPSASDGIDFVTCPVLGIRTLNIKKEYIEGVLLMSVEDFKQKFPDTKLICPAQSKKIKASLSEEIEPGVTKHALSVGRATEFRAAIGEDGLSINARKGKKTRETHMKIGEDGLNGYQRLAKFRNESLTETGQTVQQVSLQKRAVSLAKNSSPTGRSASKASIKAMKPIIAHLVENNVDHYFDNNEYVIKVDKNHYFFDLIVPSKRMCVEYQSRAYHPNPFWDNAQWNNWKPPFASATEPADNKYLHDIEKAKSLWKLRGFRTWFVWEDSVETDTALIMEELKNV